MIQQPSKLCLGAMKMMHLPSIARSVTRISWQSCGKSHSSLQLYSTSTTTIPADDPPQKNISESDEKKRTQSTEKTLTKRWLSELPNSEEIQAVLKVKAMSSAIEISTTFTPQQRIQALKNLVATKSRPLPLIQKLTEGISEAVPNLNVKELSDLLFVSGKLKCANHDVLSRTCEALKTRLKDTKNAAVVGSSISSLRTLQWKDPDLLDEFAIWLQNNIVKFQNPSTFIYTLALQNHSPPNMEELLNIIWKKMKNASPVDLINLVWSINVLNSPYTEKETRQALNDFFTTKFLKTLGASPEYLPVWIKLWNLKAVAKSLWGQGDLDIPPAIKSQVTKKLVRNDKAAMVSEVTQLLFKDFDSNLYSAHVPSNMGFPIDFIFCINRDMTAVPIHVSTPDSTRVAVMIHSFQECCQPTKEPNGYRVFEMRMLEEEYKVISVPYHILGGGYAQVHEYFESALSSIVHKKST